MEEEVFTFGNLAIPARAAATVVATFLAFRLAHGNAFACPGDTGYRVVTALLARGPVQTTHDILIAGHAGALIETTAVAVVRPAEDRALTVNARCPVNTGL